MSGWKVPMPRKSPPADTVDYRIGFKFEDFRVELDGRVSVGGYEKIARILQNEAIVSAKRIERNERAIP